LPEVGYQTVSDDYFTALQIPLQAGRAFDQRDHDKAPGVAIVSAAVAKQFWGDASPIGARIRLGPVPSIPWSTVIGVAGDVRLGPAGDVAPIVYVSSRQDHWSSNAIIVKTNGDPAALVPAVRNVVKGIDPMLAVVSPLDMAASRSALLADRRVPMQIMTAFGILALGLAGLGVFGTMAYSVASRTREIGLRVALGAEPREVIGLVLRQGLFVWLVGIAAGTAGSVMLGRAISGILYGTAPTDPSTLVAVAVILLLVTLAACLVPARRAVRIDPMIAMRAE
jgi:predicted permease